MYGWEDAHWRGSQEIEAQPQVCAPEAGQGGALTDRYDYSVYVPLRERKTKLGDEHALQSIYHVS
jgi:hypothetical protein